MAGDLSPRLAAIVETLPLTPRLRVLEIGGGPGAAARAVAQKIGDGHILGIDRSAKAIALAKAECKAEIASGRLSFRQVAVRSLCSERARSPMTLRLRFGLAHLTGATQRRSEPHLIALLKLWSKVAAFSLMAGIRFVRFR